MTSRILFAAAIAAIAGPAHAGFAAPTPEAGAGLAALAMLGAGYAWLRKRAR